MPHTTASFGFSLLIASLLLTSCAATPGPAVESNDSITLELGGVNLDQYSNVTAKLDFDKGTATLPVDAIKKSAEIDKLMGEARRASTDSCLEAIGLPGYAWPLNIDDQEDRLYGIWSVDLASQYGYEKESTVVPPDLSPLSEGEIGCFESTKEDMSDLLKMVDKISLDDQVFSTAYDAVKASAEGKAAIAAARACMEERGLAIDSQSGMPQIDPSVGNSEVNVRIAVVQATCNTETGAIKTLYDLTARYQAALIDRNEAAAVALAAEKVELVTGFQKIIDANR